jgi:hypothetical protein
MNAITKQFALVLLAALALPGTVLAQEPARIGNIWGGVDHQPTPSEERALARSEGVKFNTTERRRELNEIYTLDKQLLGKQDNLPPGP